jgi:murein DD-endopeptidase MepM/ murein hydrolase activator NlpD
MRQNAGGLSPVPSPTASSAETPDARQAAVPQTRRAARAAGVAAPVVLTEAQEREAERAAFENAVRPRGRRAAASTEQLATAVAFEATEPEIVAAGVSETVTAVSAVDITVETPDTPVSDAAADIGLPAIPAFGTGAIDPADVLGEVPAPPKGRKPGRRVGSDSSDDENTPPRVKAGRRAAATPAERTRVSSPKSASDASGNGAGEAAIPPRRRRPSTKSIAKKSFGMFAFLVAGGIAVATSLPAEAYFAATPNAPISHSVQVQAQQNTTGETTKQQLRTEAGATVPQTGRDSYTVTPVPVPEVSMTGFSTADTFSNDVSGTIQWPFPTGVPISDGFGYRSSPGGIGSTNHQGIDFNPGMGAPIQVIADGTVRLAQKSDAGGYGCYVIVDHEVNGMEFASLYGHMQCSSVEWSKGDAVKVGQQVGNVGSTGTSTGAHLHFEIHDERDTPVDPMPWLNQYAN